MTSWNYRIIRIGNTAGIYEVYYNEAGEPISYCDASLISEEGPDGLLRLLVRLGECANKPSLVLRPVEEKNTWS